MTSTPDPRTRGIVRVLSVILVLNWAVALAKIAWGLRAGAIAVTADGVHSLLDGAANVVGLVGVMVAARPPDDNHPYGHRKYETFAALAVAFMMFIGCWEIGREALTRLRWPRTPDISPALVAMMLGTLAVNAFVAWFERREARRLQSEILLADAAHTGSDVLATGAVLVSFAAVRLGWAWADLVAAVVVVILILRASFEVLQGTLSVLSDERRVAPDEVERAALLEPGVREVHNVRSRGPLDHVHVDLHVLVDPAMAIAEAHALGHRVEGRLRRQWPSFRDVVVHVEPALETERASERIGGGLHADD